MKLSIAKKSSQKEELEEKSTTAEDGKQKSSISTQSILSNISDIYFDQKIVLKAERD